MRMLLNILLPHEEFNDAVNDGTAGETLEKILEEAKPESIYFTEQQGQRAAVMVVNVESPSQIPFYSEPWFLSFNADVEFRVAMTPAELKEAALHKLADKWGE